MNDGKHGQGTAAAVNCILMPVENRAFVVTTRELHAGEELLLDYGPGYWKATATAAAAAS